MNDKCPVCNHDLIPFTEGSTTGVRCSYCDYSIVTTYIEPIYEDDNTYTVVLEAGNSVDMSTIKVISKITGKNYIFSNGNKKKDFNDLYSNFISDMILKNIIFIFLFITLFFHSLS